MIAPDLGSWTTKNTTESPIPRCHPSVPVWWLFEWDEKANRLEFRSLGPPVRIGREILPLELPSFKSGLFYGRGYYMDEKSCVGVSLSFGLEILTLDLRSFDSRLRAGREVWRRSFALFWTWNLALGASFVCLRVTNWTRSLASEFRSFLDVKVWTNNSNPASLPTSLCLGTVFLCARRFVTTLAARIAAADALLEAWLFRSSLRLLALAVCASSSLFHVSSSSFIGPSSGTDPFGYFDVFLWLRVISESASIVCFRAWRLSKSASDWHIAWAFVSLFLAIFSAPSAQDFLHFITFFSALWCASIIGFQENCVLKFFLFCLIFLFSLAVENLLGRWLGIGVFVVSFPISLSVVKNRLPRVLHNQRLTRCIWPLLCGTSVFASLRFLCISICLSSEVFFSGWVCWSFSCIFCDDAWNTWLWLAYGLCYQLFCVFDLGISGTFGTLSFFYICILVLKARMRERIFCGDFVLHDRFFCWSFCSCLGFDASRFIVGVMMSVCYKKSQFCTAEKTCVDAIFLFSCQLASLALFCTQPKYTFCIGLQYCQKGLKDNDHSMADYLQRGRNLWIFSGLILLLSVPTYIQQRGTSCHQLCKRSTFSFSKADQQFQSC